MAYTMKERFIFSFKSIETFNYHFDEKKNDLIYLKENYIFLATNTQNRGGEMGIKRFQK